MMREDPGCFVETIANAKDHRREHLPFPDRTYDPILQPSNIHTLFHRTEGIAIAELYLWLEIWEGLDDQIVELKRLKTEHEGTFAITDPLPKKYLMVFLKLRNALPTFADVAVGTTADKFHASPSTRPFCIFAPTTKLPDQILNRPNVPNGSKGLQEMRVLFDQ